MCTKIGDTVICVNNSDLRVNLKGNPPALVLYEKYKIKGMNFCDCGRVSYDVGLPSIGSVGTVCVRCNHMLPNNDIHWCASERFVTEFTNEHLEAAVKEEQYELAAVIRDELNK